VRRVFFRARPGTDKKRISVVDDKKTRTGGHWFVRLVGIVMAACGLYLLWGGVQLVAVGGSWYYLIAGIGFVVSGVLLVTGRPAGLLLYGLVFVATLVWALAEVGIDFWPLVPRLVMPAVLALVVALIAPAVRRAAGRPANAALSYALAGVLAIGLIATGVRAFQATPIVAATGTPAAMAAAPAAATAASDWRHYGKTPAGTRFAPYAQINQGNVDQLQVAWQFRTGDPATNGAEDQSTPMQIGDTVFICTPHNQVFALNAETGEQRWKFDPKASSPMWQRCRGLGYYETAAAPATPTAPAAACASRIIMSTIDARLIALDSKTGLPCADFGKDGTVSLGADMGEVKPGYYFQTSAPTVVRGKILIGGWVADSREINEPSGVIRAFDARTGALAWAWDLGNPAVTGAPPPEGYSRGTPNVWSTPSFDDKLGLVYLPTGNATPDFWGAHRSKAAEEYTAAVVALDIDTGRERWKYRTVHHDLWDYDLPAQPALHDIPDGKGGTIPALVQLTKRGQIFLLNRETGVPLAEVQEKPVPQGGQEGDWLSPTQPYSVGMPSIGTDTLKESDMWGGTPFDQLWCRIAFKKMRYEGEFTPPTLAQRSLLNPGYYGGMNWGSASINESNDYLIVNDIRTPQYVQLIARDVADSSKGVSDGHAGLSKQTGTPYGVVKDMFMSPMGIPCVKPPYGTMTAIDLKTRKIVWQVPMGTVQDTGPMGIKMGLPLQVGMPTLGGPVSTQGGVVFYAGTQDFYLRAMDVNTGKELWKGRLPVGAQATPMTYMSPESGRQFVVISAGGARLSPDRGDYIVAYALPKGAKP
jgi:quinate dehydrogenase (quinone)